ncbi:hypothetical protein [Salmonella enterica]|uniref:hypothetical protein n=1 Tax=Salmonella enterica TaxID=28901 RepID=UPI00234DAC79|nr:hypothetical protein [Salmonella enterica]MDJ4802634.1 hypothetical protein [Salmonella enterica]
MSLWLSIVTRATGLPDKRYLNDPVILRYYQQKIQKAPYALVGWTLCFMATIGVSLGLDLSNQMLLLVLLILIFLMVVLQGGTSSCIRKDVSMPNFTKRCWTMRQSQIFRKLSLNISS